MSGLQWNGEALKTRMRAAVAVAVDQTLAECVSDSRDGHPAFPPASVPFTAWANRTGAMTGSVRVLADAHPDGPDRIKGSWGSLLDYSLFLEVGTSRTGPTATARMVEAGGDPNLIVPELGPLMARRWAMIPVADRRYPELAAKIAAAFDA